MEGKFKRRAHYEKACNTVAQLRNSDSYIKIPFDHLIPLPFYLKIEQLDTIDHASTTVENIFQQYDSDPHNLLEDWIRYFKHVTDEVNKAQAIFEGAVWFTKETLPPDRREKWASSVLNDYRSLQLSAHQEQKSTGEPNDSASLKASTNAVEPQTHIARERNGNLSCGTTSVSVDNTSVPHLSAPTQPVQDLGSGASQHDISVSTQPIQDLNSGTSQHGFPVSPQNVYTETQVIMKDDDDQVQAELNTLRPTNNQDKWAHPSTGQKRKYIESDPTHTQAKQRNSPPDDGLNIIAINTVSEQGIPSFLRPLDQPIESRLPLNKDQFLEFVAQVGYMNAFNNFFSPTLDTASGITMICPWVGAPFVEIKFNVNVDIRLSEYLIRWFITASGI